MRPVKDTNVFKQDNGNATTLSFRDFGAKLCEQSLDVAPLNARKATSTSRSMRMATCS